MQLTNILNHLDTENIEMEKLIHFVEDAMQFAEDEEQVIEEANEYILNNKKFIESNYVQKTLLEPNEGPQDLFVNCPYHDILYGGALGGGKSMGIHIRLVYMLEMCRRINKDRKIHGYKEGDGTFLIIRKDLAGLEDLISESHNIYPFLGGVYTKNLWTFKDGFKIRFGFIDGNQKSFNKYQGKRYIGIYIDEAGQYTREEFENIKLLKSRLRNTFGFPSDFVMTANPGGPGHQYLKQQYQVTNSKNIVVSKTYKGEIIDSKHPKYNLTSKDDIHISERVFIPARLEDNPHLMNANYKEHLLSIGLSSSQIDNLLEGNWNIDSEGMFDDIFSENTHVLDAKDVIIPKEWIFTRGYDYGTSAPYACLIFAENNGRGDLIIAGEKVSTPIGTKIIVDEEYGGGRIQQNKPHIGDGSFEETHAERLYKLEEDVMGRYQLTNIYKGYADSAIFDGPAGNRGIDKFRARGLDFLPSVKGPNSRSMGWSHIRSLLNNSLNNTDEPHLYVMSVCDHTIRLFLNLQRDVKRLNGDLKERSEDHIHDVIRYNTYKPKLKKKVTSMKLK